MNRMQDREYPSQNTNIVGDNVKKYRRKRQFSQKELSRRLEALDVRICRGSISRIEQRERSVTDYELKALAQALEISILDLLE